MRKYKNTLLASLGTSFEYYDFVVYALMAPYFSEIFFQGSTQYIKYYLTFALGYLFRPLGGILSGLVSDKFGRKKIFLTLIMLMAISTCFIGLLPVQFNLELSTTLLVICRIMQGLALGGEFSSAVTFIHESNKDNVLHTSFITSSATLGNLMAIAALSLLSSILTKAELLSWGWRIPFLISGLLGVICYRARKHMNESTEFAVHKESLAKVPFGKPILEIFSTYRHQAILGTTLSILISTLTVIILYMPTSLTRIYSYSEGMVYKAMAIAFFWSLLLAPLLGYYKFKLRKINLLGTLFTISLIILIPSFQLLSYKSTIALILFLLILETVVTTLYVYIMPILTKLFPVSVRNTGTAFCYNIGFSLASLIPGALSSLNNFSISTERITLQIVIGTVLALSCATLYLFRKLLADDPS